MNPFVLGPIFGGIFGVLMGMLMNSRVVIGSANWIPTYTVLGILSGLVGASKLYNGKVDPEKGELLTETKEYKKKFKKRKGSKTKDQEK